MKLTHNYKHKNGTIEAFDIRPEAITESRFKRIAGNFKGRSCGDVFAWKDGETGILLGIDKNENLNFLSELDTTIVEYKGVDAEEQVPVYLKVPKKDIKWHSIKTIESSSPLDSTKPKTEKKDEPITKTEQSFKKFSARYTHAYKTNIGRILKLDVRPEAISENENKKISDAFKGRSCGDVFYCYLGKVRALMGINTTGQACFVSKFDGTVTLYDGRQSLSTIDHEINPPMYLQELPKQEIKWHSVDEEESEKQPEKKDEPAPSKDQKPEKEEDQLVVLSGANTESKTPKRKRRDYELEINSDEDIGEIKWVRPSDRRMYGLPGGGLCGNPRSSPKQS
jgi:hypothetical protein